MMRILVVDDESMLREMVRLMLETEGWEVVEASNGVEALGAMRRQIFDAVLTDLVMPEMEGIETIMKLREHNAQVVVVAMSGGGRGDAGEYLQVAQHLGADATLRKPFTRAELVNTMRECMARKMDNR